MKSRIRAWLDILRISNAPTCISNVLVGWMIGGGSDDLEPLIFITLVIIAIYLGGMIFNDVFDADWTSASTGSPDPIGEDRPGDGWRGRRRVILTATASTFLLGPAVMTATCLLTAGPGV